MKVTTLLSAAVILFLFIGGSFAQAAGKTGGQLTLRIQADIDGSDRLSISEREVLWIH